MGIVRTRVTAQGQVSVLSNVRKKWHIEPGSVLEWKEDAGRIVVHRLGSFSSEDIHHALFKLKTPKPKTLKQLKQGIRDSVRKHYARD